MSVLGLTVTISGREAEEPFREMKVALERSGAELVKVGRYVFPELVPLFEGQEKQQFAEEGAGPHGTWQALSPGYSAWKSKRYPGKPILEREGRLKEALTSSSSPLARRTIDDDTFIFGTQGVPYAMAHQVGVGQGEHEHLPARPPVDFGSDMEADLQRATMRGVRKALRDLEETFDLTGLGE